MSFLERTQSGRLLTLTLNRPEKRNALNAPFCREIVQAVEEADSDPGVGAILFVAAGKAFCAGMDLDEIAVAATPEIDDAQERLFTLGARVCTPLIGAVERPALGGGAGLVANFHIVIASPEAVFGLTEIRLGLWPFLIFRAVSAAFGERRAIELALTGRIIPADEAREYGLVHEVSTSCRARAREIAEAVASSSPTADFQRDGVRPGQSRALRAGGRGNRAADARRRCSIPTISGKRCAGTAKSSAKNNLKGLRGWRHTRCMKGIIAGFLVFTAVAYAADEAQDRAAIERVVEALNGERSPENLKRISTLFTPDAENEVNRLAELDQQMILPGGQPWSEVTAPHITIRSIRFISPEVALVDAVNTQFGSLILVRRVPLLLTMKREPAGWRIASFRVVVDFVRLPSPPARVLVPEPPREKIWSPYR